MSDVTLRRRIAALVGMAFLSVMGATVAAATGADSADASPGADDDGSGVGATVAAATGADSADASSASIWPRQD